MPRQIIYFILLILLFSCSEHKAQWEISAAPSYKWNEPSYGVELKLIYRLPFQFPDFGVKAALNFGQYYQKTGGSSTSLPLSQNLTELFLTASLITSMHLRYIQPYAVLGFGSGYLASSLSDIGGGEGLNFILSAGSGVKGDFGGNVNPYLEIYLIHKTGSAPALPSEGVNHTAVTLSAGINFRF